MPKEYYDRGQTAENLAPASRPMQEAYGLLRSRLTQALARHWDDVLASSPEIASAAEALDTYVEGRPRTAFRIFRPEDARSEHSAGDPVFLR